jgi:hypothetical protein
MRPNARAVSNTTTIGVPVLAAAPMSASCRARSMAWSDVQRVAGVPKIGIENAVMG